MSKKSGTIIKLLAIAAGVAAVGTACYLYKDKIKEFFEKLDVRTKFDTAKSFVTDRVLGNKEEDFFDDADFFDDDEDDTEAADAGSRGYTSITISSDDSTDEEPAPAPETSAAEPTVSAVDAAEEEDTEDIPYENEGLSDVSEDEDVLAEETSLDGSL